MVPLRAMSAGDSLFLFDAPLSAPLVSKKLTMLPKPTFG